MGEAPEVFEVDDKGYLNILQEEPPEALREKVEMAVKHCPTGALSLED
jgi:ferredoxin